VLCALCYMDRRRLSVGVDWRAGVWFSGRPFFYFYQRQRKIQKNNQNKGILCLISQNV